MDPNEILKKILRRYGTLTKNIRGMQIVESKIRKKIATYADAEDMSIRIGKALTTALAEYLPEALTDGMLYRAIAEVVVEQPMKAAGRDIAEITAAIQKELNKEADIGMKPIVPEMNQDQIDGIITGICNAESYEAGKDTLFVQVENCLEGYVDDFVRENADFQYRSGLSPTIERKSVGKCCEWCSGLTGNYPYDDVQDRGNDVFRRHKYCHCQILYNPGDGSKRRQNVRSRQWTAQDEADRIAYEQIKSSLHPIERGFMEAKVYGKTWQEGSLQETIAKFAPGASPVSDKSGRKIGYYGDRYIVAYDTGGNYFKIFDTSDGTNRPFVDLDGNKVLNIEENGKQRGASKAEYEALTHFRNTDSERRR